VGVDIKETKEKLIRIEILGIIIDVEKQTLVNIEIINVITLKLENQN
jgi:hypothetical protein